MKGPHFSRLIRTAAVLAAVVVLMGPSSPAESAQKKPAAKQAKSKQTAKSKAQPDQKSASKKPRKRAGTSKKRAAKSSKAPKKPAAARSAPLVYPRAEDPHKITFTTVDQAEIAASWVEVPGLPAAPAVLLVHSFSRDRREWEDFIPLFTRRGLAVLSIDLRGHGESRRKQGKAITVTPGLLKDPNGFPRDVEAACAWLRGKSPRIAVTGFQAGANLAVLATANGWADAAVAFSASMDNLELLAGNRPLAPASTLLLASTNDPGREASAAKLDEIGKSPKKIVVFAGAAHGRALFETVPEAQAAALDWLVQRLGAVPPPPVAIPASPVPVPALAPVSAPELAPVPHASPTAEVSPK